MYFDPQTLKSCSGPDGCFHYHER